MVAISLTAIGAAQLYSLSIPGQFVHAHSGPVWTPRISTPLMIILSYHAIAVSCLWAMALIRIDGVSLPQKLVAFSLLVGIVPILAYPTVMVVPWQSPRPVDWFPDGKYFDAIMRVITAVVTAALVGRALAKGLCPTADLKLDPLGRDTRKLVDLIAMISIAALLVGWQSLPALILMAACLSFLLRPLLRRIPPNELPDTKVGTPRFAERSAYETFTFALPLATTLHLVFWRVLWRTPFWPSDQSGPYVIVTAALAVLAVPVLLKAHDRNQANVRPRIDDEEDDEEAEDDNEESLGITQGSGDDLPEQEREAETDDGDHRGDHSPGP